ncbi:ABC-2 family transporter [Anaerobacterium chartisolvens]|uniref:ABC-2 family transporter n=1 Tax=Anaerobacterium chartisolvens TaxID=1297424 RepID=A0A369BAD1_9FIRM|nr:ABC transporter permease [Anaerobacterium chartisolvens]RCX18275.1 ABC-2 family transporter [Anaerobacterium chartisolvens]
MLKLIELEIKKFKLSRFIKGVLIADLIIAGVVVLIMFGERAENRVAFEDYRTAAFIIGAFVKMTFTIFAAVILSKIVIGEYKSNTIGVLFMYPISRKRLIAAKLAVVMIFTFLSIFLSDIFIGFVIYVIGLWHDLIPVVLTAADIAGFLRNSLVDAAAYMGVALAPLYFGMRKKSTSATIVSSVIICSVLNSGSGDFSLGSIIIIPILLAVAGVVVAYLTIRNIDSKDIMV